MAFIFAPFSIRSVAWLARQFEKLTDEQLEEIRCILEK